MSSNKFLQRFEGKIKVVGKEGVHNVFGAGKTEDVIVYTNNNFNPQNKNKTSTSLNKPKPQQQETPKEKRTSLKKMTENVEKKESKKVVPLPPAKEKKPQNPYLVSNPFYLDEDDRIKMENERKEQELKQKALEKQLQQQQARDAKDAKKTTTGSLNRSLEKKKNEKEWVKLGGLGANIGGDQWMEKKKKQDKIQEFSEQVKQINKDKPKVPKPERRDEKKDVNPRQKALEYSKNVPKPTVRSVLDRMDEPQESREVEEPEHELSELQQYQLRHQQLKNMLRNQL